MMTITVTRLWRYPLKSAAAVSLQQSTVRPRGLEGDRRWMLIDPDGRFITSRTLHALVTLPVHITDTGLRLDDAVDVKVPAVDAPRVPVTIWKDTVQVRLAADEASQWISSRLGVDARLVYMGEETRRTVDPEYADADDVVSFADGFPLLLISEASLADLNSRLARPVTMMHFRPNLVVTGCPAFDEDRWRDLQIGEARFRLVKRCSRCILTTIDPQTGTAAEDGEPLRTLKTYRRDGGKVMFGQNLLVAQGGTVRVGDRVTVLR